ncbi:hypothetical protein [Bradyrhizobium sp.]
MVSLGMFALGAFIGFVIAYGLTKITDWTKPASVFSAIISAAVAGGVFTFIQYLGGTSIGTALFLYPVGLAYGALCSNLRWVTEQNINRFFALLHIAAFAAASVLLLAWFLYPPFRDLLP